MNQISVLIAPTYTDNFNNDISSWNVLNVINMNEMFKGSTSFKTHLQGWILNPGSDFTNIDMFINSSRNKYPCLTDSAVTECGGDCKGYNHGIKDDKKRFSYWLNYNKTRNAFYTI